MTQVIFDDVRGRVGDELPGAPPPAAATRPQAVPPERDPALTRRMRTDLDRLERMRARLRAT